MILQRQRRLIGGGPVRRRIEDLMADEYDQHDVREHLTDRLCMASNLMDTPQLDEATGYLPCSLTGQTER